MSGAAWKDTRGSGVEGPEPKRCEQAMVCAIPASRDLRVQVPTGIESGRRSSVVR